MVPMFALIFYILVGESSKYGAHVVQEDQLCEKVDNAISAEAGEVFILLVK